MKVYLVETMDEVLRLALAEPIPGRAIIALPEPIKIGQAAGDEGITH
jgi:hypothetical protein